MPTFTIIGAGNVAQHLAKALQTAGHPIEQVYNRSENRWQTLQNFLPLTHFTTHLEELSLHSDIYLIAVSDDAIAELSNAMPNVSGIVVHTSGATSVNVLNKHVRRGIFYPLQTFTATHAVNFAQVPFCVDANTNADALILQSIAHTLSPKVYRITDEQRQILHVSAVFANNFTNHLLAIAENICQTHGVPFEILKPLIAETLHKIESQSPRNVQTGPAKRADVHTLNQHLQLLTNYPQYQQLYRQLSESILQMYANNKG